MLLFVVAACMIPLLIQGRLIAQSSRQMQVERRIIDVQNQCQILSNKMSRNGYLGNSAWIRRERIRSCPCWQISSMAGSSL